MIMDVECPKCRGDGWIPVRRVLTPNSPVQVFEEDCPDCNGSGVIEVDLNDEIED